MATPITNTGTAFRDLPAQAQAARIDETARRLVQQEVAYCVSGVISALYSFAINANYEAQQEAGVSDDDLREIMARAPDADDFRDRAGDIPGGALQVVREDGEWRAKWTPNEAEDEGDPDLIEYADSDDGSEVGAWRAGYDLAGEDYPDGSEVYEHWAVSDWFARRLIEEGEAVAQDIAGLTVWGRCTTGQSIYMDGVLQRIARSIEEA